MGFLVGIFYGLNNLNIRKIDSSIKKLFNGEKKSRIVSSEIPYVIYIIDIYHKCRGLATTDVF